MRREVMKESTRVALAAGIASGYVMGRTKKAKVAFALASYVVGRGLRPHPRELAHEGVRRLQERPALAQLGDKLQHAGRTAAEHRIGALADALHERTEAIRPRPEDSETDADADTDTDTDEGAERHRPKAAKKKAERPVARSAGGR
jgi:hypothetical protein